MAAIASGSLNHNNSQLFNPVIFPQVCRNNSYYISQIDHRIHFDPSLTIILIIIIIIIMVTAFIGNFLIIITIYYSKRLHTNSGYLMANLAAADLLFSCTVIPSTLVILIYRRNILPSVLCVMSGFFYTLAGGTSIATIASITTDRFIAVFKPLHYPSWMSSQFIAILIAFSWIFAGIHAVIPMLGLECYGLGRYTFMQASASCWIDSTLMRGLPNQVYITLSTIEVCLLLSFVVFSYIFMYCKARDSNRKVWSINLSIRSHAVQSNAFTQPNRKRHICKATKTTLTLISAFLVCWTPAALEAVLALYLPYQISDVVFLVLTWLTYLNSAINPIIYGLMNRNFIESFRQLARRYQSKHCNWIGPLFGQKTSVTLVENIRDSKLNQYG
ncbi:Beta-1 adrenergic receptor [Trichoplax sp. H2]|nr:Beta-1 adrenergic receptor [Trichoplax sp. H2]|eukprot:RDD44736.1 Beta-1 adrenergic receptor [Trichoplax sp. H2]